METTKDIIKECGLEAAFQEALDVWNDVLSEDWISQDEFDRVVWDKYPPDRLRKVKLAPLGGGTLIPPLDFAGNEHLWALNVLKNNGYVEAKKEGDLVYYRKALRDE